jgi:hypothetical protein
MSVVAFELNLTTDEPRQSDPDPRNVYSRRCWHVQYEDGAIRVYGMHDDSIRLLGKAAVDNTDTIFTAAGDIAWGRVADALSRVLTDPTKAPRTFAVRKLFVPTSLEEVETVSIDGFVTFDYHWTTAAISNVATAREEALRAYTDDQTWQIVVIDAEVRIFAAHAGISSQIGRALRHEGDLTMMTTGLGVLSERWAFVANAITSARKLAVQAIYEGRRIPIVRRRLSTRHFLVGAIGVIYFLVLLYLLVRAGKVVGAFPLRGPHAVFAPLFMILAPLAVAIGLFVASSPRARADNQRRRSTGRVHPGPRTSAGMGIAFVGTLLGLYPIGAIQTAESSAPYRTSATLPIGTTSAAPTPSPPGTTPTEPHAPPITPDAPPPILAETIARLKPTFGDGVDNAGARELARFASMHVAWRDVTITDAETSIPLVLKDPVPERGKRLCATGALTDIERADLDNRPAFSGTLRTADGDDVRFIAVGSTGALVKRSTGTICGVVTGRADKAVMLVGMFDLPENAMPAVER